MLILSSVTCWYRKYRIFRITVAFSFECGLENRSRQLDSIIFYGHALVDVLDTNEQGKERIVKSAECKIDFVKTSFLKRERLTQAHCAYNT